jgi:hypothetical protein
MVDVAGALAEAGAAPLTPTEPFAMSPAPGGQRLVVIRTTATGDTEAMWVDSATSKVLSGPLKLDGFGHPFALDDGRVLISHYDRTINILPTNLQGPAVSVDGTEGFSVFDIDDDTGRILIGAANGRVGLLDVDTATVAYLEDADGALTAGAFAPDGQRVAVFSVGNGVQLLDVASGRKLGVAMKPLHVRSDSRITWADDGSGVWLMSTAGPVRLAADSSHWRGIACRIVHRELTPDEWRTFVSDTERQADACS